MKNKNKIIKAKIKGLPRIRSKANELQPQNDEFNIVNGRNKINVNIYVNGCVLPKHVFNHCSAELFFFLYRLRLRWLVLIFHLENKN